MKLLFCKSCQDVVALRLTTRSCFCGESGGQYVDNINAKFWGKKAILIGFNNGSLNIALYEQNMLGDRDDSYGRRFEAFIIPEKAPSVKKVENAVTEAVFHNDPFKWPLQGIIEALAEADGARSLAKEKRSSSGSAKPRKAGKAKGDVQSRID